MRKAVKTQDMVVGKVYYDYPNEDGVPYRLILKNDDEICLKPVGENLNNYLAYPETGLIPFCNMGVWFEEVSE